LTTSATARELALDPSTLEEPPSAAQRFFHQPLAVAGVAVLAILVLVAVFAPYISPYNPDQTSSVSLAAPSATHLMGTDQLGRDVFSRMLAGTRVSLVVGVGSTALGLVVGGLLGTLAGISRGKLTDAVVMRTMDVLFSFPILVFVPVLSGLTVGRHLKIGPVTMSQMLVLTGAIAVVLVPVFARVVRASVLAEMGQDYMLVARAFGARRRELIFKNLLPNVQGPLIVQATFSVPLAIVAEAAVSFLGFGIQPPQASWGDILNQGRSGLLLGDWWETVFPALAIALSVLAFNFIGDALRDVLDSRGGESTVRP